MSQSSADAVAGEISVRKNLKNFIPALSKEEYQQLEKNLLEEGCRDPLVVWEAGSELVLVDGFNRYKICTQHRIPFQVEKRQFKDEEEAKDYMINNQLGRRNLHPDQLSYFRGLKYERLKKHNRGYDQILSKGQNDLSTADRLAQEFKVSEKTIKRDAEFSRGIELIGESNPKLKQDILAGKIKVKKSDVQELAKAKDDCSVKSIKNEADLYNKAQAIRRQKEEARMLENRREEEQHQTENEQKVVAAQQVLKATDPVFNTQEERLNRLKGQILSAVNQVISHKNRAAYLKLKIHLETWKRRYLNKSKGKDIH